MRKRAHRSVEKTSQRRVNHPGVSTRIISSLHKLSPETRKGIGVVFLWAIGILSLLSIFGLAGSLGDTLNHYMGIAFGVPKIAFPLLTLFLAVLFTRRRSFTLQGVQVLGLLFFILSFFAFWHIRIAPESALRAALAEQGGGLVGIVLGYSLQNVLGLWASLLVLVTIILSSSLIVLNMPFHVFLEQLARIGVYFAQLGREFVAQLRGKTIVGQRETSEGYDDDAPEFSRRPMEAATEEKQEEQVREMASTPPQAEGAMEVLQPSKKKQRIQLSLDLLSNKTSQPTSGDLKTSKLIIQKTFENFNIPVEMGDVNIGPTVTQYTLKPSEGVKVASIIGLHNDLALALAAHPIRIEAPIPGKSLVGIEVPNQKVAIVTLRELLESEPFKKRKNNLQVALGKDVSGLSRLASVASMPHLLIAGSTGSGKTVCINTLIMSLLFQNSPEELRFIMVDPKRVELPCYNDIPHLLTPVITDIKKTINALKWTTGEMERRFTILAQAGKRDIASYNMVAPEKLAYIVVIIDELADIMVTAGPEAETLIIRLAQMARAVGIHLVLATQRPSADVITGLIKANITSRIAFAVASQIDSRTILDTGGAERLIGRGDMLYLSAELSKPVRIQGAYVSDEEIDRVVRFLKESGEPSYEMGVTEKNTHVASDGGGFDDEEDDLLGEAREVILQAKKASASLLQRRLRVGYARAARILDLLEAQGFIGPADGARPRDVLVRDEEDMDIVQGNRALDVREDIY